MINAEHHKSVAGHVATEDITFGYCTEIMVALKQGPTYSKDFDYDEFRNYLNDLGDSLLVVNDDEIVKSSRPYRRSRSCHARRSQIW